MKSTRALELFSNGVDAALCQKDPVEVYQSVQASLSELIGFKLLTILRLNGTRLERLHTSDPQTYSVGGFKDISHDKWLQSMLNRGTPVISPDPLAVQQRFVDYEAIFDLGCGSVLNVPVTCAGQTLGSLNLLHEANWFTPSHVLLARPFAALLAVEWLAPQSTKCSGD